MNDHERRATTEALFRNVNERIAESAERFGAKESDFVCECADEDCTERVRLSLGEYERLRANPRFFVVRTGHEEERIERVVSDRGRYRVVEKVGAPGELAEDTDPRS